MRDIEEGFELIRANADAARFAGPRAEPLIAAAERALGVRFPPSYRSFLLALGAGSIRSREFYGVIDDDWSAPGPPDAIGTTLAERGAGRLPEGLVIVGASDGGGWYVLDCGAAEAGGEAPVLIWAHEAGGRIAGDFGEFFAMLVAEAVDPPLRLRSHG
jgi:antitoxin YobK